MEIKFSELDWKAQSGDSPDSIWVSVKIPSNPFETHNELLIQLIIALSDGERMREVRANLEKAIDIGAVAIDPREFIRKI